MKSAIDGTYYESEKGHAADHVLDVAIHEGTTINYSDDALSELEDGEPGFFRDEIAAVLAAFGMVVPSCLGTTEDIPAAKQSSETHDLPVWMRAYATRIWIPLSHAADILSGLEPGDQCEQDDVPHGYQHWIEALKDAADTGQIDARTWSMHQSEQPLSHASIRAWCTSNGIVWPVPLAAILPGTTPAPVVSLTNDLVETANERDVIRGELNAVTRDRDALRVELTSMTSERDALRARFETISKENELAIGAANDMMRAKRQEKARSAELEKELVRLRSQLEQNNVDSAESRTKDAGRVPDVPDWISHETRLFKLLPRVICAAKAEKTWPKQAAFVSNLKTQHSLSEAEAKALDMVTRPDSLRGR